MAAHILDKNFTYGSFYHKFLLIVNLKVFLFSEILKALLPKTN